MLNSCTLCPHNCKVNRLEGKIGRCKCNDKIKVALASLHMFEEPCISGANGSGTVFFSNCNLNCIYCQNYKISQLGKGKEISIAKPGSKPSFVISNRNSVERVWSEPKKFVSFPFNRFSFLTFFNKFFMS